MSSLLLATLFGFLGVGKADAQITVPCDTVRGMCVLAVRVNGASAHLLVDTGAQTTTFSSIAAARLGLHADALPHENRLFTGQGTLNSLDAGPMHWASAAYAVAAPAADVWSSLGSAVLPVDGSLGLDLLSRVAIGFDLAADAHTLTLWPGGRVGIEDYSLWFKMFCAWAPAGTALPESTKIPPATAIRTQEDGSIAVWLPPAASMDLGGNMLHNPLAVPPAITSVAIREHEGRPWTVEGTLDGSRLPFDIDTGTTHFVLPSGFSEVLHPVAHAGHTTIRSIDSNQRAELSIYRDLTVGRFAIAYPAAMQSESEGRSGLMRRPTGGMDLFAGCRMVLDFPAHRMYLARPLAGRDAPKRMLADLGIFLAESGGARRTLIGSGSPADRLGMKDGDQIHETEGLPPARPDESVAVTRDGDDRTIRLFVRRSGSPQLVEFAFPPGASRAWNIAAPPATFPQVPEGFNAARRFPLGGLLYERDGSLRVVRPGGSVLLEAGRYLVTYRSTGVKSFRLTLPSDKYHIFAAPNEPGRAPLLQLGQGAIWVGGVGWIIGPNGERLPLDGFSGELRSGR